MYLFKTNVYNFGHPYADDDFPMTSKISVFTTKDQTVTNLTIVDDTAALTDPAAMYLATLGSVLSRQRGQFAIPFDLVVKTLILDVMGKSSSA